MLLDLFGETNCILRAYNKPVCISNHRKKACAWTTKNIRSCNISTKRNEYQLVISALARRLSEFIISTFHTISYTYKYSTKISGKLLMINFFQTGPEVARLVQLGTKNAGSIAHLHHHAELQHHLGCGHWSLHWRRHLAKTKTRPRFAPVTSWVKKTTCTSFFIRVRTTSRPLQAMATTNAPANGCHI